VKPFAFLFQDPRWVSKILIGGLFQIASMFLIGIFFVLGYCARLARNVIGGVEPAAPEWDDLGEYFVEGLRLFGVGFVYMIPFMAIICAAVIPTIVAGSISDRSDVAGLFASGFASLFGCLLFPLMLAFSFWIPGALLMTAVDRNFSAGFEFGRIWSFIRTNIANYLLAFLVMLIARFATPFGLILFCIGVVFTTFWAMLISTYAFGQAYRLSTIK
jgi:uncharacterized protein DUF4013